MEIQQAKIAVLILNWNGRALLERFLPSIVEFNADNAEVYVIDNASTDDSVDYITKHFPSVKSIVFKENYGYAKGYNKALELIPHEYALLLNSDVRVSENWIEPLYGFLETHSDYVACQAKILDEKKETHFEYAGACGGYIDRFGYPFCRGRIFDSLEEDKGQYDSIKDVFWASGAALFIRRKEYIETGGLDVSFFAHQEEIDLCWRLLNRGYKIACIPESKVYHLGGASLDSAHPRKTFLNFRNNLVMLLKNLPLYALPLIFFRLLLDGIAGLKYLSEGKFKHCWAIVKAHFSFYSRIPGVLFKRKKTLKIDKSIKYRGSILVDYYLKGGNKFENFKF
jgi:GT2 family glycosyltransferase